MRANTSPRLGKGVAVTGCPLVSVLGAKPTVGFGHVGSTTGINDNPAQMQISKPIRRGNSGGPVFDQARQIIGVVASKVDVLRIAESVGDLPQNLHFAARGETTRVFLDRHRATYASTRDNARLDNTDLAAHEIAITMRARCDPQKFNKNNGLQNPHGIKQTGATFPPRQIGEGLPCLVGDQLVVCQ